MDGSLATYTSEAYSVMCTIFLILSIYIRYDLWLKWSVSVNMIGPLDNLYSTGLWKYCLVEMGLCSISPLPFLKGFMYGEHVKAFDSDIEVEFNDILLFMMFIRIYLPCRFLFYMSEFMNPRTQRVCQIYSCNADSMFALKALMKQQPMPMLFGSLACTIIIFGYHLRLFESILTEVSGQNFSSFNNAMWNMIITLTSAGYGELYPKTSFGRIIGTMICFWGVLIISFFVVTITNMLEFTPNEARAFILLQRLSAKAILKVKATKVL